MPIKLTSIIFFNLIRNKKVTNSPKKKIINGILLPENNTPTPRTHIANVVNVNLALFLLLNMYAIKNIEKKENLCIKPPAIISSPKKPEL